MAYKIPASREEAEAIDAHDILGHAREAFDLPEGLTYLDGHSLGPATHNGLDAVEQAARQEWRNGLIRSWNEAGWFELAYETGSKIARLIGARPEEVIVADSVSANLFKLGHAARGLATSPDLIVEADDFPTDQYMIEALASLSGSTFHRAPPGQGLACMEETGGILIKSVVNYRTAAIADIADAEARARACGGVIIWDLSHATGIVAVNLTAARARLATGCTYKYLNGGPGAPAFVYAAHDIIDRLDSPLPGWMGHAKPFDFAPVYKPAPNIRRFAAGTPPILSLAALSGALEVFEAINIELIHAKTGALGDFILKRTDAMALETISPRRANERGGHVSVRHENGYEVVQALIADNIIADFRAPDTIRFGVSPLYLTFTDIWDAMDILEDILATARWDKPSFRQRAAVT